MKNKTKFHSAAGTVLCITVCKRGTSAAYGQQIPHINESPAGGEIIMPPLRGLGSEDSFLYRKLRFATHTVMHNLTPAVLSSHFKAFCRFVPLSTLAKADLRFNFPLSIK